MLEDFKTQSERTYSQLERTYSQLDTAVVGLISNDEMPHREGVRALAAWCSNNHLNTKKTKEMIIDFRKTRAALPSGLSLNGKEVEWIGNFMFPGCTSQRIWAGL